MSRVVPTTQEEVGPFVESVRAEIQSHHTQISDLHVLLEQAQAICQHPEHIVDGWARLYCTVCGKER